MKLDEACYFHTFQGLMADKEKWDQVRDPSTEEYAIYQGIMAGLACFAESSRAFRLQVTEMTRTYFEPLKRRTSDAYAQACSRFYSDMLSIGAHIFNDEFEQSFPVEVGFVPMTHPTEEGRIFVAEKSTFNSLADFLRTEFYRGLALGNAPRQCHNCGRYFLLTAGYNTCYCNNVAPGELERACRKVGAHRKEALGKANRTPARKEYDRPHNRLKARKQRGRRPFILAIYLAMLEAEQDQRRFTRLFEAHEKKIYAVALRVLGDPNRAEDAARQTWLQLIKN